MGEAEYGIALMTHPPGRLLGINMRLGRELDLIPNDVLSALLANARALHAVAEENNSKLGVGMLPKDAYSALFSTLQVNSDAFYLPECACDVTTTSNDTALNVLRLDVLLSRYVSDGRLVEIFSVLDKPIADPDDPPEEFEKEYLPQEICTFVAETYAIDKDHWDSDRIRAIESIQNKLINALHEYRPTFRTGVPFFWVGFDEPGRSSMTADELRDALGICWDEGVVLLEIQFSIGDTTAPNLLYYRPTAINSINSEDGKGGRFMACASAEWPPNDARSWHGTTAHLAKVTPLTMEPLDSFKELIRKPMPLDAEHLKAVRIIGVVRKSRPSDDAATLTFADRLSKQFKLDEAATLITE